MERILTIGWTKLAYALIIAYALIDCVTTFIAVGTMGFYELSPFVRPLYDAQDYKNILMFQLVLVPSSWYAIYRLLILRADKLLSFLKSEKLNIPIATLSFIAAFSMLYLPVLFNNIKLILLNL